MLTINGDKLFLYFAQGWNHAEHAWSRQIADKTLPPAALAACFFFSDDEEEAAEER